MTGLSIAKNSKKQPAGDTQAGFSVYKATLALFDGEGSSFMQPEHGHSVKQKGPRISRGPFRIPVVKLN